MTPQSKKSKGRLLQQWVVKQLLSLDSNLTEDDIRSTGMGQNGADVQMSSAAKKQFPISIECKNIAAFAGYKFLEQSEANSKTEQPIAVVKANRKKPIVLVDAEYFFQLVRKVNGT